VPKIMNSRCTNKTSNSIRKEWKPRTKLLVIFCSYISWQYSTETKGILYMKGNEENG
jgi:hypothetical protein